MTQGETEKETEREWGSFKEDRGKEHTESRVSRHIGLVGFEHFNYDFQLIKTKVLSGMDVLEDDPGLAGPLRQFLEFASVRPVKNSCPAQSRHSTR